MALPPARWYAVRRAASRAPKTYRCPLCGGQLLAMTEHVLITPEGDGARRRHAHTACAVRARREGRLPDRDDFRRTLPREPSLVRRLLGRFSRPA